MNESSEQVLNLISEETHRTKILERLELNFSPILEDPLRNKIDSLFIPENLEITSSEVFSIKSKEIYPHKETLKELITALIPWRKGPFSLFDEPIDSGWRSFVKYNHLKKRLPNLQDKIVLDLGCNNGYYLFRMLFDHQKTPPKLLIGFEPFKKFLLQYLLIKHFIPSNLLHLYPLGWKDLDVFEKSFDVILCMGILYHHPSPIDLLKTLSNSLRKGGEILLETMTINMSGSYALFPSKKYMGASGMWFIPTLDCLVNWIKRCGFNQIDVFEHHLLEEDEQVSTPLSPFTNLNFEQHKNENKTMEGYPPPYRTYVRISK